MLRNSLLVSVLLLAGSFGFAGAAKAVDETKDVIFTGSVASSCTLKDAVDGTLTTNPDKKGFTTANAGKVDIDCENGTLTVSVTKDDANSDTNTTPGADIDTITATVTTADGSTVADTNTAGIDLTATDKGVADVTMTATDADVLATGTYKFKVIVTAAPGA